MSLRFCRYQVYGCNQSKKDKQGENKMQSRRALATVALSTALGIIIGSTGTSFGNDLDHRVAVGFEIAKQQGIALDQDRPVLGLGSYLVNSAGCNDCHTWPNYAPGGDPFERQPKQVPLANYLAGGRLFALPTENVCSRNLTPAPGTHMAAGLSRADFTYILQTGCDPQDAKFRDPQHCELLQVMPWPNYQDMRPQEISAIYSYLSALPHAKPGAAAQCKPDPQGIKGE
jgi:hypothetical protein